MQGTIVKIAVEEGATVAEGDLVVVLEAMKMEQPLNAHKAGTITGLTAEVGATVTAGAIHLRNQRLKGHRSAAAVLSAAPAGNSPIVDPDQRDGQQPAHQEPSPPPA